MFNRKTNDRISGIWKRLHEAERKLEQLHIDPPVVLVQQLPFDVKSKSGRFTTHYVGKGWAARVDGTLIGTVDTKDRYRDPWTDSAVLEVTDAYATPAAAAKAAKDYVAKRRTVTVG